ncbi:hypothetical protein [Marinobacter sp. BGYM27]|uniref:hypothetical protein n=1 Tax=unclassified Marinobacter TaxID=83889 RepID=UPI0021A37AF1|nr:hypothetical protein [Marinobacter sp. BGYM27]MDG5499606.1 hypothetical protein [Marinobacter sp. BGYM27]
MQKCYIFASAVLLSFPVITTADETIADDLIVQASLCAGEGCVADIEFDFDTLRLQSPTPQIEFQDTSGSASFPGDDWSVGITDGGSATPTTFFIKNLTHNLDALVISADGDVALGAGAAIVAEAVSVGDLGSERRVTHVADGVDDSDAVSLAQFNAFKTTATTSVSGDVEALDTRLSGLETRLSDLVTRLEAVATQAN